MSGKIFQNIISQLGPDFDRTIGVLDDKGFILACSDLAAIGSRFDEAKNFTFNELSQAFVKEGRTYKVLPSANSSVEYITFVDGEDLFSASLCSVLTVALNEARVNFDEKHNKAAFIKNIISDNILPGDVYVRAKELRFNTDDPRCAILVRQIDKQDVTTVELISKLFPDKQNDFVISVNDSDIVIIKLLENADSLDDAYAAAKLIEKQMHEELGIFVNIGISTPCEHLRELADKFKEAQVAIEVGNIFTENETIFKYDSLGLGRIIYQLPTRLCEMFLNEVFKKNPIDDLDADTLETIDKFFENNLNVSETSRKLYVHRNTLVYRLEKIKKLTGLDLREFDHAIVFKVALMVKMYLDSINKPRN